MSYKNETPHLSRMTSEQGGKIHSIFLMKHEICLYDILIAENRARCIQAARFCKASKISLGLNKPSPSIISFVHSFYESFVLYRDLQQQLISEFKEKFEEDF